MRGRTRTRLLCVAIVAAGLLIGLAIRDAYRGVNPTPAATSK